MTQKIFTFSKHFQSFYPEKYIPVGHIEPKGEFVSRLLKQGYLVKDIKIEKVIKITAFCARANIPLKERQKLQLKIK